MRSAVQTQGVEGRSAVCLSEVNVVCPVPAALGGLPAHENEHFFDILNKSLIMKA